MASIGNWAYVLRGAAADASSDPETVEYVREVAAQMERG